MIQILANRSSWRIAEARYHDALPRRKIMRVRYWPCFDERCAEFPFQTLRKIINKVGVFDFKRDETFI
jgi:hypothetical protein